MTDARVSAKRKTRGLTTCVYVMWSAQQAQYKIGESSDVAQRLNDFRTACPDVELVGTVIHPSSGAIEARLHAYFKDARVQLSEWFRPEPDVIQWVTRFRERPNVANTIDAIRRSYPTPDLWPWSENAQPCLADGQLGLDIQTHYRPLVGTPSVNGQTSSISEDWYTPPIYVEAVRELFGGMIDLDPASCAEANLTVRAEAIFTAESDGLRHRWFGHVFLNPPWGRAGTVKTSFVQRALHAYVTGEIRAAVLVLNANATTTAWFQPLFAYPICFPNHRVSHYGPGGAGGSPNTGTVFVYLGPEPQRFGEIFSRFGAVVHPLRLARPEADRLADDTEGDAT